MRALILVFATLLFAPAALAQSAVRTHVAVRVAPECGGTQASGAFAAAVRDRLPEARVTTSPSASRDANVRVRWAPSDGGCAVEVADDAGARSIPLAEGATQDEIVEAASRVAWLVDLSAANTDEEPPAVVEAIEPTAEEPPPPAMPTFAFGLSIAPGVNVARSAGDGAVRHASLTLFGSRTGGLRGGEIGLVFNRELGDVVGFQAATAANWVDGALTGAQVTGGINRAGAGLTGAQFAPVNVAGDEVLGAQVGLVNVARASMVGVQNGVVNVAGDVTGAQMGTVNRAGDVTGAQYGMVNLAGDVRGAQIGLVNVADTSAVSLGLINVMREHPVYGVAWVDTDGFLRAGIHHGSRVFRNVLVAGVRGVGGEKRWSIGGGWVGHIPLRRLYLELDVLGHAQGVFGRPPRITVQDEAAGEQRVTVSRFDGLLQLRASLGLPFDRFAIYIGATQNALFTQDVDHDQPWGNATPISLQGSTPSTYAFLYPSFFAGIRF